MLSCRLHHDTNNFAITIDMTFAMDVVRFASVKRTIFHLTKSTALFSTETAKQEL
jgi:hypothetical protein